MYTAFYGLREKPFALSPDPRFLYLAGSHREALAHLLYGIEQGEGFISVTGEVGTGKTTLCRTLLERLEGEIEVAFLFNPSRTALELLQSICAEFGLPAEGLARRSLMAQLNGFLLEKKREGRRVLLIIDEAQTLSESTLEQVRLLSNLETSREKLIQILLLGQPELDRKLDERGLRQLRQRISVRWELAPLAASETRAYVRHRIAVAAGEPKDLFSDAALSEVHRRTGGIPRLVNQLCDRTLLGGYASRAAMIGPSLVRAAAKEIPDARRVHDLAKPSRAVRPWLFFAGVCLLVGLGLLAGLSVGRTRLSHAMQASIFKSDSEDAATTRRPSVGAPPPLEDLIGPLPAELLRGGAAVDAADRSLGAAPRIVALAPGLLAKSLESRSVGVSIMQVERRLLAEFDRQAAETKNAARDPETLKASMRARGLEATPFSGGSLSLLRRLDHPVALELGQKAGGLLGIASGEKSWVIVTGFDGKRVRVSGLMEDRDATVPIEELERHWTDVGIVVWERFESIPPVLIQGDHGDAVMWLQQSLVELDFLAAAPSGLFDSETVTALLQFQRDNGLVADGVAGPLTQIALFARIERYPVPRLSAKSSASIRSVPLNPQTPPSPRTAGPGERG